MKGNYLFYAILMAVVLAVLWIINDMVSQPGIGDLDGEYRELAVFRNENNTGPVIRIYAVYAADTLWDDMRAYGDFMPHTKYGNTKVYFISQNFEDEINVSPEKPHLPETFHSHCVALYEKSAMGEVNFRKFPFRE